MDEKRGGAVSLAVLAAIGVVFALYLGSELLVPIGFAVVLSVALRPVVRVLKGVGVPAAVGGGVVVLGVIGMMGAGGWLLERPVRGWVEEAPRRLGEAEGRLARFRRPVEKVTAIASRVQREATGAGTTRAVTRESNPPAAPPTREGAGVAGEERQAAPARPEGAESASEVAAALGTTRRVLAGVVEVVLMLYLLLASDNLFMRKLIKVVPRFTDKEKAVRVADEVEGVVLRYLWVTLLINVGQGTVVGLVMWWLGMPAPVLWGLGTVVMEFVPYLGATVMVAMLAVTSAATFDEAWRIVGPPGAYLVITTIQNTVVSPYLYGSHLKLNPVAVLVGVLFWWFVWGVPGAFLAVPVVATLKIVADRVEGWKGVGEFLGE